MPLQTTIDLTDYLPDNVYLAQSSSEVAIHVTIDKITQKTIAVTSRDITMKDKQSGCTYSVTLSDDFKLVISGLPNNIDELTITELAPTIDCSKLVAGENYNVVVTYAEIDGVTYNITGTVNVFVKNVKGGQ